MPVEWEWIRGGLAEDFQALDGDEIVGRVYQYPHGPQPGLWFWTMTVVRPGPRLPPPTSGTETRRGDAGRRVTEAYSAGLLAAGLTERSPYRPNPKTAVERVGCGRR
jgi:hypothetical protein